MFRLHSAPHFEYLSLLFPTTYKGPARVPDPLNCGTELWCETHDGKQEHFAYQQYPMFNALGQLFL